MLSSQNVHVVDRVHLAHQASLFDRPLEYTEVKYSTPWERFTAFHTDNPQVYAYLRDCALQLRRRGVKHWSMRNLWECLRMDYAVCTNGEPFKLDNNHAPFYSRLLMESEPELRGFFEVRG